MIELANIINRYQKRFIDKYGDRVSDNQQRAMGAIQDCHTQRYGKMALQCSSCDWQQCRYHSCGHRFCPRCQNHDTTVWLERQRKKLLPVDYFMVTFTLPYELRPLAWHHQKQVYKILFNVVASTLRSFALNDKKLGAEIGMTAVLHTHSRRLEYHPHLHVIVPGGCINKKRGEWKRQEGKYLFNAFNLSKVFRARFLEAVECEGLVVPTNIPNQWVVDCAHVGKGLPALKYLSRYLYRGVLSEKNIVRDDGQKVTFRYKESSTGQYKTKTLQGEDFVWLLIQHVLPKGFRRVRDFGFLHGNAGGTLRLVQLVLRVFIVEMKSSERPPFKCIKCKQDMVVIGFIPPAWRAG